jgi:DNA-binding GntR family transcriptional regulator
VAGELSSREPGTITNTTAPEVGRLGPLVQSNLRERAREMIRAGIVSGQIQAGQFHPVSYFQAQLQVSATPIREAIFDLANEGLIEVVRNRGFRVPVLNEEDLAELFELRDLLEVYAVGKAAGRIGGSDILDCLALAEETRALARVGNLQGFLEADRRFHQRLLAASGNRRLADIVGRLRDATPLYQLPQLAELGQLTLPADEHVEIVKAMEAGDPEEAKAWMRHHIDHIRGIWLPRKVNDG